jgi:hypothetical protein
MESLEEEMKIDWKVLIWLVLGSVIGHLSVSLLGQTKDRDDVCRVDPPTTVITCHDMKTGIVNLRRSFGQSTGPGVTKESKPPEQSAPANPTTGFWYVWQDSKDHEYHFKSSEGKEYRLCEVMK